MDILVKTQATADINIIVPLALNTGAPDTGATLSVKAINPDGTENTAYTAPVITEVVVGSGAYRLTFAAGAANKLFVLSDENNPYTLLVTSTTTGSTQYRAVRVYCVSRLPGEYAKTTDVTAVGSTAAAIQTVVDSVPTLVEIEASTVLAKDATVAKETTTAAIQLVVDTMPTLAEIEASSVLAKEATTLLVKKFVKNKKVLTESGGVYSLVIYDDNGIDEILRKTIKDIAGADITAIGTGVIARESKSSV